MPILGAEMSHTKVMQLYTDFFLNLSLHSDHLDHNFIKCIYFSSVKILEINVNQAENAFYCILVAKGSNQCTVTQ